METNAPLLFLLQASLLNLQFFATGFFGVCVSYANPSWLPSLVFALLSLPLDLAIIKVVSDAYEDSDMDSHPL